MQLGHLAEMEAHDGQRDGQWEQPWTPEQSPEKEPPIMGALDAADAQLVNGASKGQDVLRVRVKPDLGRVVLAQKSQNTLVIELGGVDLT